MITTNTLKPKLTMDDVDIYLPRGMAALKKAGLSPRGFFRLFQRHEGARFFGCEEYLSALASLMSAEDIADTTIYSVPEGYALGRHETAMTIEGPATALLVNETLLHFLSTGTRFRTLAATYPVERYPWAFMGARYLASDDLAIATRALSEENILSTTKRWASQYIGTESHSQIAMWAGLRLGDDVEAAIAAETNNELVSATIRATVAFHLANPEVPLYVLGDFAARSVGCFEVFRATAAVCANLDIPLRGGRMDISKADLNDKPIFDPFIEKEYRDAIQVASNNFESAMEQGIMDPSDSWMNKVAQAKSKYAGMGTALVSKVRNALDEAGLADFRIIVSSGIKLEDIDSYIEAGANLVGIGEEAAYFLNKGECNFTSDAIGYFQGDKFIPFAKEGREITRILDAEKLSHANRDFVVADHLVRRYLTDYL